MNGYLLLGTGTGTFQSQPLGTFSGENFAVADLNADGHWDFATANPHADYAAVVINSTDIDNTPFGSAITLRPIDPERGAAPVELTFELIVEAGMSSVESSTFGPLPPAGFRLGIPPEYFHIFTTALFSGFVTICIDYNPLGYSNPDEVRLFHYDNGLWEELPSTNDSANGRICGETLSLSPFALLEPIPDDEPEQIVLAATKDAVLQRNEPNLNGGANPSLTVSDDSRVLVGFDLSDVDVTRIESARLVMTVDDIDGAGRGVVVDAHPVTQAWKEGNGQNGFRNELGIGEGVTWNCATDGNIGNRAPNCAVRWSGGSFAASTADGVRHARRIRGEMSWDVTADVAGGAVNGWLLKLASERGGARIRYTGRPAGRPRLVLELAR